MLVINGLDSIPLEIAGSIVALGNFDGVHLGHEEIIKTALASRNETNKRAGVVTFYPHPTAVLRRNVEYTYILSLEERLAKLAGLGLDFAVVIDFTNEFASIAAEEFVEQVLIARLKAAQVLTGCDFRFGSGRAGDTNMLSHYAAQGKFSYKMIEKITYKNMDVSSTVIKELLASARLERANHLLGAPYYITGTVTKGSGIAGKTLETPTANILVNRERALPHYGVYLVRVTIEKRIFFGIANLGTKPTVGGETVALETHIFDFNRDIYDKQLKVEFLSFIRPEYEFNSLESLKTQIRIDTRNCNYLLRDLEKILSL